MVPDPPRSLSMLSRTWESVELSWIHGFDGGYPQGFVVTYKTNTDENGRINVTPANSTKFNVTGKQMKYTKMIKRQCIISVAEINLPVAN